jgi:hypothetical protein
MVEWPTCISVVVVVIIVVDGPWRTYLWIVELDFVSVLSPCAVARH